MSFSHKSVLLQEAADLLGVEGKKGVFVDATFGFGGHSAEMLRRAAPGSKVIALDCDRESLGSACEAFGRRESLIPVHSNFSEMEGAVKSAGFDAVDAVFFDLGVSSLHFDDASRGFSFRNDAPLDMRLDRSGGITAAEVVNTYPRAELERVIRDYGEEKFFRKITGFIIDSRPINTTAELASVISRAVRGPKQGIHPATRAFQAVRIEVNGELEALKAGLAAALKILKPGGRMAVISFQSLEDRIVKRFFGAAAADCVCENKKLPCICGHKAEIRLLTKKPVVPGHGEKNENPRSRSAKLRAAEKI